MRTGRAPSASRTWGGERPRSGPAARDHAAAERPLGARADSGQQQAIRERWDVLCTHLYRCRCGLART